MRQSDVKRTNRYAVLVSLQQVSSGLAITHFILCSRSSRSLGLVHLDSFVTEL